MQAMLSHPFGLARVLGLGMASLLLTTAAVPDAAAENRRDTDGIVRGPLFSGTIRGPRSNDAIAMKGLIATLGENKDRFICFDADLMRVSMAWTSPEDGGFLRFGNTQTQISWPPPPQVLGETSFETATLPGWSKGGSLADTRTNEQGPLAKDHAHYKGLYLNGEQVVFEYTVGAAKLLETHGLAAGGGTPVFTRTIQSGSTLEDQQILLASGALSDGVSGTLEADGKPVTVKLADEKSLAIAGRNLPDGARLVVRDGGHLVLHFTRLAADRPFAIAISTDAEAPGFSAFQSQSVADLRPLTRGGEPMWTEQLVTEGQTGGDDEAYVVDWITEPVDNPYNAKMFFGGFDFFEDGRAAVCTFHGDVWVVDGIDGDLNKLTWKRYASGLFQPLGLKIEDEKVYVLGRDQITRLHDLNNDGEADRYENFNNDTVVTANYHEFNLDLHTDTDGNFYFAKGAPWEPLVTSPSQGTMIKVSKDGAKMEVIATGLRAPNGMTVGPENQITVGDNQGHWMPSSKLSWVEPGGFYGMMPAAQKELTLRTSDGKIIKTNPSLPASREEHGFKGWNGDAPIPERYDEPFVWLPQSMDNSSGGQVFVTSDKWGPFNGKLMFMSYGKCTLFEVMMDKVGDTRQGAMVQFPLKFNSGLMRARFHPEDGQLYVMGLKGWQTSATRDGGFYRVRYTGKTVHMPDAFQAAENGIKIGFTSPVDPEIAGDPDSYNVERWNYRYSGGYGSPEYSVDQPDERRHDRLTVKSARVSNGGRTVWLEVENMKPADQIKVQYSLDAADGELMEQEIYATAHKLHPAM